MTWPCSDCRPRDGLESGGLGTQSLDNSLSGSVEVPAPDNNPLFFPNSTESSSEEENRAMGTNVGGPESPEPACWGGAPSPFVRQILPCQTQSICISANPHSPPTRGSQSKIRLTGRPASTECSSQGLKNPNIDPIAPCGLPSRAAELSST